MTKYIKLDDAIRTAIQAVCAFNISKEGVGITQFDAVDVAERMEMIPVADVAEVKHGEWRILTNCSNAGIYCSECHKSVFKESYIGRKVKYKFCPNCGADMRG